MRHGFFVWMAVVMSSASIALAEAPPSPAAAMRKLLESGRVPEARLPTIVKMICERGNEDDLTAIFSEIRKEGGWSDQLKGEALEWLSTAAVQRKVHPSGDLTGISQLIESPNLAIQQQAVQLAGLWKVAEAEGALAALAEKSEVPVRLRKLALQSLASLDQAKAESILTKIAAGEGALELRSMAAGVLAEWNPRVAAQVAARILNAASSRDQVSPLLDAFLQLKGGSEALAVSLKETPPSKDMAKLLLRQMYSVGRTDAELNSVLLGIAGINQDAPPPTREKLAELVAQVAKSGDPVRGEEIFRRVDLSCLNCHSVNQGGGNIGPDLSAIGSSSPVEYLIMSLLDPDQSIKEAYVTKVVATVDGKVLQGIVSSRTNEMLILKDATGKQLSVPVADIDDEVEGKSLMPKGLANFMTEGEFLDLIAFLGELGKPGPYGIRDTQRMQRYRFLNDLSADTIKEAGHSAELTKTLFDTGNWGAIYARANGQLPLQEIVSKTGNPIVYLRGDLSVLQEGAAEIQIRTDAKFTVWLDEKEYGAESNIPVTLSAGEHSLFIRADLTDHPDATLTLTIVKPAGSASQFGVVDGP